MERSDSRLLPVAALNERRRRAVKLRLSGMKLKEVCALSELSKGVVIAAFQAYQRGGWDAVAVQEHRGPEKGTGCIFNEQQQRTIRGLIHAHTPDQLGLPYALWSRSAVSALIEKQYGMVLPVRTVGSYLQRWGFTPQRPLNKAYEQNPAAVQAWLNEEYPRIARRAKEEGGEIHWGDEAGLRSDDVRGRSYAPRGETPVVRPNHRRENVGLISTVTNRGTVRWMVLHKAINAVLLIAFLQRLAGEAGRKVFLILDNLKVHHAPPVVAWLAEHRDRIEVFYLPSYSPELNPDELLNADLKEAVTKKAPARHKGELKKAVISHLRRIGKLPGRVKKYFQHPLVKYAA
ncbi:MAG TPA: IS630 family transposase [Noviherbaspirillum sp.]|nr:IS630 family transposase [Noviherbaspirillum sp.]